MAVMFWFMPPPHTSLCWNPCFRQDLSCSSHAAASQPSSHSLEFHSAHQSLAKACCAPSFVLGSGGKGIPVPTAAIRIFYLPEAPKPSRAGTFVTETTPPCCFPGKACEGFTEVSQLRGCLCVWLSACVFLSVSACVFLSVSLCEGVFQ